VRLQNKGEVAGRYIVPFFWNTLYIVPLVIVVIAIVETCTRNLHQCTWPKLCSLIGRLCLKVSGTRNLSVCHPYYSTS